MESVDNLAVAKSESGHDNNIVPIEVAWRANRTELIQQKKASREKGAKDKTSHSSSESVSISAADTLGDSVLGAI